MIDVTQDLPLISREGPPPPLVQLQNGRLVVTLQLSPNRPIHELNPLMQTVEKVAYHVDPKAVIHIIWAKL